jgi:hypothetical protein
VYGAKNLDSCSAARRSETLIVSWKAKEEKREGRVETTYFLRVFCEFTEKVLTPKVLDAEQEDVCERSVCQSLVSVILSNQRVRRERKGLWSVSSRPRYSVD